MRGNIESLKALLSISLGGNEGDSSNDDDNSNGANTNIFITNTAGDTLLHSAAANGMYKTCKFLIDQGIEPNVLNCTLHTPLHLATLKSSTLAVKVLINNGLTKEFINAKNNEARTALHESATLGNIELTKFLLENGAVESINAQDFAGETPLHGAVRNRYDELVKILRQEYNANHTIRNTVGESPFSLALNQKTHNYSKCYDQLKSRIEVRKKLEQQAKILTRPKYVKRASILDQIGSSRLSPEERNKKRAGVRKKAIEKMAQNETRRAMFASSAKSGLTGNYFIVG